MTCWYLVCPSVPRPLFHGVINVQTGFMSTFTCTFVKESSSVDTSTLQTKDLCRLGVNNSPFSSNEGPRSTPYVCQGELSQRSVQDGSSRLTCPDTNTDPLDIKLFVGLLRPYSSESNKTPWGWIGLVAPEHDSPNEGKPKEVITRTQSG